MLYKIGRIVTFEICNMLQLTVAIGSEEVTENQQKSVIVVQLETTAMPISPRMTRKYRLPMLPWPLLQRGETLSKFSTSSALKVLKDFHKFPNSCNHFIFILQSFNQSKFKSQYTYPNSNNKVRVLPPVIKLNGEIIPVLLIQLFEPPSPSKSSTKYRTATKLVNYLL